MNAPSKILILRVGRVGDLVMITPALRALLCHFPESEFQLMVGQDSAHALKGFDPRITRVHVYDRRFLRNRKRQNTLKELQDQDFSRVYVFETNPYYHKLAEKICPDVYGVNNRIPDIHYSRRCLDAVQQSLSSPVEQNWITLPVIPEGREKASEILEQAGVTPESVLIGMHLGNSAMHRMFFRKTKDRHHRAWPLENFAQLAKRLAQYGDERSLPLKIIVDLLPQEQALGRRLLHQSDGAVTLIQAPPHFERYKALLKRLSLLVTPNTGPMHIAAAVGTPVVALFSGWSVKDCGPFVPESRYAILRAEDTPQPQLGLAAILSEHVFEACLPFLEPARHPGSGKVLYNESG